MKIIGLTGSIAMGKSTTAQIFSKRDIPVFDADKTVHALQQPNGKAYQALIEAFPQVYKKQDGQKILDRADLRELIFNDIKAKERLEAILHPLVAEERRLFLEQAQKNKASFVVLDIPLLFELGLEGDCDCVLVVTASHETQKKRVLSRQGLREGDFDAILKHQMSDAEKKSRADYIIDTGKGIEAVTAEIELLIALWSAKV